MTVTVDAFATGWCYCGRKFSPTNERVGGSCRGCLTEWVTEPDRDEEAFGPVAFHPVGVANDCQGCGQPSGPRDLCVACDPFLEDLGRPW